MTYVPTQDQTANIFTKGLARQKFDDFLNKLDMINIYDPTWGGVLKSWILGLETISEFRINCFLIWFDSADNFTNL